MSVVHSSSIARAERHARSMQAAAGAMGRVTQDHGDAVDPRLDIVERKRGVLHHVHDPRVVERDRRGDGRKVAIEEDVIVIAGNRFDLGGSPDDRDVATRDDLTAARRDDLETRFRFTSRCEREE